MRPLHCSFLFVLFFLCNTAISQIRWDYSFVCLNTETQEPIPFAHIILNDTMHLFADMDGKAHINFQPKTLAIKHYLYSEVFTNNPDSAIHVYNMGRNSNSLQSSRSDAFSDSLIRLVLSNKKHIQQSNKRLTYKSYNKFTLSPEKKGYTKKIYERVLNFLSYDIKDQESKHLYLMEAISVRQQLDRVRKKETIIGIRTTGIKLPSAYTNLIHPQPFNLYGNYVNIANAQLISPLCHASYLTYAYELVDSATINGTPIYVVKYYPLPAKSIGASQGFLYIDGNNFVVKYYVASPLKEGNARIEACQEYVYQNNTWFPNKYKTDIHLYNLGVGNARLHLSGHSYIFDVERTTRLHPENFSEIVLEYDSTAIHFPDSLWNKYRQQQLTSKDKKTIAYYDTKTLSRRQKELLRFGERLYLGQFPLAFVNLDLNKIFSLNYLEGLRLGLGMHTNQNFSKKWQLGGYAGYGLKDERFKYGADVSYNFTNPINLSLNATYNFDVYEAGAQTFPFDIVQYSTEPLRKYRLSIMDYYRQGGVSATFKPIKYLNTTSGISVATHKPSYNYQFGNNEHNKLDFTEYSLGIRYAYGEEYIKTPVNTMLLNTPYPVVWLNYTQGLNTVFGGDFSYSRFDFKVQQTFKFFRFGTSGIQLSAGLVSKATPYSKLYNMKGSLRNFSVVTHNSFETMKYNEFLSDRFFAIFYSHDFGQLYTPHPMFRPNVVMLHNMGIGTLAYPELQQKVNFKTMEKGYFESGIFLKNLVVVNLSGLRTGLGVGMFVRYGHYEYESLGDNIVIKLAANFFI
jgi:hypothetical protein